MMTRLAFVLGLVFTWPLALIAGLFMLIRTAFFVVVRLPLRLLGRGKKSRTTNE